MRITRGYRIQPQVEDTLRRNSSHYYFLPVALIEEWSKVARQLLLVLRRSPHTTRVSWVV